MVGDQETKNTIETECPRRSARGISEGAEMIKTKAAFRAMREDCGMTQQDVADEIGVRLISVKKWENHEQERQPPDDVWEWLVETRSSMVSESAERARHLIALAEGEGDEGPVRLPYYRVQEELDATGQDDRPMGVVNAITRMTARLIEDAGRDVAIEYRQ